MSVYRDSRYDRTELGRKRFLGSGHSSEDIRFREPYAVNRRSNFRSSGRSLDRLHNEERRTHAAPRYPDDERTSIENPVRNASFGSPRQVSRGPNFPLEGRTPRRFEARDVQERSPAQYQSREAPSVLRQQDRFSQGYPSEEKNPQQFQARGAPSYPQRHASPTPAYVLEGRSPKQFQPRGVFPNSRPQTILGPRPTFPGARLPAHDPGQKAPHDSRQYLADRNPRQNEISPPSSGFPRLFDQKNPRQLTAGQNHFSPQQQILIHPRPLPIESGLAQNEARQVPFVPRHVAADERRLAHNNAALPVYNVERNLATVVKKNIETSPAPYGERFIQAGAMITHPTQNFGYQHSRPGLRENLHYVQHAVNPQIISLPQQRQPDQSYNHSGNIVHGAPMIAHADENRRMEDIPRMPYDFQSPENSMGHPTMYADFTVIPQMPFREDNLQMMQGNAPTNAEEMVGFQAPSVPQTIFYPDNANQGHGTPNHQTRRASVVDSNMEELISQLPSRNSRITSVQGIIHHQQHQEEQRRKVSRDGALDDGSQGHSQPPEQPEITAAEAQEELHTLREEAMPLSKKRTRRGHLLLLIQKETSSPTKELVASISSVAHTSEDVISGAIDRINFVNWVKKTMEAEAGASVAAVFDLFSDLLRLNLFLAIIQLSTIIIPSLVWIDKGVTFDRQGVSSRAGMDCGNFSNNFDMFRSVEEYDQVWGWVTHDLDGIGDVVDKFSNDSAFICSGAALSAENIQVAVCSAYYALQQECYNENRDSFMDYVLDFLQGKGFLERTSIFVGWYPAKLTESPDNYVIHIAYPLAIMLAYAVSIWYVVRGFARWLRTKREILDFSHLYNNMIFRGWDCNIANEKTAITEKKLLATEIKAAQWEEKFLDTEQNRNIRERRILLLTRAVIHLLVFGLIGAGWTAIYYVVVRTTGDSFLEEYAATMTIGALNFVLPLIFFGLSKLEQYQSKNELLLFIIRNIFVRLISIIILAVSEISSTARSAEDTKVCNAETALCWETKLAQQIYSLIIFDTLLYFPLAVVVFIRNGLRKVSSESCYIQWIPKPIWTFLSNPEFDTAGQVLRVVHVQTLCWMGLVCAPMIPLITSMSFIIMILLNGATIFFCNLRPLTVFRGSRSSSTFTGAILIGLVLSMIPSAIVFSWLRPSLGCSPFRGLDYAYHALIFEICRTPKWLQSVLFYLDNFVAVGLLLLVLLLTLIYFTAKAQTAAAQIKTSEKRLKAMARDKRRLVNITKVLYTH